MDITRLGDNAFLVNLPIALIDSDEKQILDTTIPKHPYKISYIILDFSKVETMNGLGASLLVKLSSIARQRKQVLLAFGVSNHYKEVLELTALHRVIQIHESREHAFKAAGITSDNLKSSVDTQKNVRDIPYWAKSISQLTVPQMPPEAINKNMKGRRVVGPVDGFGQLWQKTYRLVIEEPGLTPLDIIKALKQNFPSFQPPYNHFYPSPAGIQPGEVIAIDSSTPGGPVSTGVMVLYADDKSFTFITPQGHPESGWVTFTAFEKEGKIIAQILGLARANDPVYEIAFRAIGSEMQIKIWKHVLTSLAAYLKVPANVTAEPILVDKKLQWSQTKNTWYNAQIRTIFHMPVRWLSRLLADNKH